MRKNIFTTGAVVKYNTNRCEFTGMVISNPIEDSLIASSYHELNLVQLYGEKHRASDIEILGANFSGKFARVDHFFTVKPIDVIELVGFVMKPDQVTIIAEVIKFILRGYSKYEYKEVFDMIEQTLPTTSWDVHYIPNHETSVAAVLEDTDDEVSETTDGSDLGVTSDTTDTVESESVVSNDSEDIAIDIALKTIRVYGLNKYCHDNGLEDRDKRFGFIVKLTNITRSETSRYHREFKEMQEHFFVPQYCWSNMDEITKTVTPSKKRVRQSWKSIDDLRSIMDAISEHGLSYFMLTHGISNNAMTRSVLLRKIGIIVDELGTESDKLRVMALKWNPEIFKIPFNSAKPSTVNVNETHDTKEVKEVKSERKIPLKSWGILGKCPLDIGIVSGWYEAIPSNVFDGFAIKYVDTPENIENSDSWIIYVDEESEFTYTGNKVTVVNGMYFNGVYFPLNEMVHIVNGVITERLTPFEFYAIPSIGGDGGKMALMNGYGRYIPNNMTKSWSRKETSVVLTICKALGTKEVFETGILRASSIPIMMDKIHRESERYGFRRRYEEIASRLSSKMRKKIKKTGKRR